MSLIERYERIEKASELHLKGWKFTEIARELQITPAHAKTLIEEYKELLRERAQNDPEILDRLTENTLEMLEEANLISKEIWLTYEKAKDFEMVNQQNATLKNAMDIMERKAKLLQLMGAKVDNSQVARLQKAEQVNEIIAYVIKEIIADCSKCRLEAQIKLAEAFSLMNKKEENVEMREIGSGDIVEAEEVSETFEPEPEIDPNVLKDVISDD